MPDNPMHDLSKVRLETFHMYKISTSAMQLYIPEGVKVGDELVLKVTEIEPDGTVCINICRPEVKSV